MDPDDLPLSSHTYSGVKWTPNARHSHAYRFLSILSSPQPPLTFGWLDTCKRIGAAHKPGRNLKGQSVRKPGPVPKKRRKSRGQVDEPPPPLHKRSELDLLSSHHSLRRRPACPVWLPLRRDSCTSRAPWLRSTRVCSQTLPRSVLTSTLRYPSPPMMMVV